MGGGAGRTQSTNAFMATHGKRRHGHGDDLCTVTFGHSRQMRSVIHAWTGVGPDPQGVRTFPLVLADIDFVRTGRSMPIHPLC